MDTAKAKVNLASGGTDLQQEVLYVNFNQDSISCALTTKRGCCIYALKSTDDIPLIYDKKENSTDLLLFDLVFADSIFLFASLDLSGTLKVCHLEKGIEICNITYSNSILALKLNRRNLVIVLENSILIHGIKNFNILHTIKDTPNNHRGLCCLSSNNENQYFAYPGSTISGDVQLFDITTLSNVGKIKAHRSPLAAINFDSTARRIATASEKGTLIRVFSVPDGQKFFECRRGSHSVSIGTLAFSPNS